MNEWTNEWVGERMSELSEWTNEWLNEGLGDKTSNQGLDEWFFFKRSVDLSMEQAMIQKGGWTNK